ncbi:MAG TPA: ABC transporter substrate-binding protein [Firmicutes bacterium]|nr:ABC transporter substrate-binding protein [Bacillota bacterium]
MGRELCCVALALIIALVIMAGGCAPQEAKPAEEAVNTEPILVGAILPMTGGSAEFGQKFQNAYMLAVEEINATGGINGRELELLIEDTQGKPDVAKTAIEKLLNQDEVVMIVGGHSSSVGVMAAKTCESLGLPYLVEHPSADDITKSGYKCVFRLNPTASMYSTGIQKFLLEVVKPDSIAVIHEDSAFGTAVWQGLEQFIERENLNLVAYEKYTAASTLDFKPILSKIKSLNPDVVIMTSYVNDAVLLALQAKEIRLEPKALIGTGAGHSLISFVDEAGNAAEYIMSGGPWRGNMAGALWQEYNATFSNRYGYEVGEHEAEAYAAIYVIADVLGRTSSLASEDVVTALKETDLETVFGKIKFEDFDGYTNQVQASEYTALDQWLNGELKTVYPTEVAEVDYVFPFIWK